MENILELDCRECHSVSHVYKSEKTFAAAKEKGGWLCPACIGKSTYCKDRRKQWLKKNKEFLRTEGIKSMGITPEKYYNVIRLKEQKKAELREQKQALRTAQRNAARERFRQECVMKQRIANATLPNEEWKVITDYSGYEASNLGRIRIVKTLRVLKPTVHASGYIRCGLVSDKDNKQHCLLTHRIIAQTWIDNPLNKPQVNHLNHIRSDNRVSNLEWATGSENAKHAYAWSAHRPLEVSLN